MTVIFYSYTKSERVRERETDRQTEAERETDRQRETERCIEVGWGCIEIMQTHNFFIPRVTSYSREYLCSSLPNKILDWSKLKALADNKINVTEKLKFVKQFWEG